MTVNRTITFSSLPTFAELSSVLPVEWESVPTISKGHDADLKFDNGVFRVWRSRMAPRDFDDKGVAYAMQRIVIEKFIDGRWVTLDRYGVPQ